MNKLSFVVATAAVLGGSASLVSMLGLRSLLDRVLAWFVVAIAQVIATLLLAGVVLEALRPGSVIVIELALGAVLVGIAIWRRGAPTERTSWRESRDACIVAAQEVVRRPWAVVLLIAVLMETAWAMAVVVLMPPYAWDALARAGPMMVTVHDRAERAGRGGRGGLVSRVHLPKRTIITFDVTVGEVRELVRVEIADRTIGNLVSGDFGFVDRLPPDAHYAVGGAVDELGAFVGDTEFYYPFFGSDWRRHLSLVTSTDERGLVRELRRTRADYLATIDGSTFDAWARADPERYQLAFTYGARNVWKVRTREAPSL